MSFKYYSVNIHKLYIFFKIIVVFLVCVIVIPWALNLFYQVFQNWGWKVNEKGYGDLQLLPDFLGGLFGVLVGFMLEGTLIKQWQLLNRYQGMIFSLKNELDEILSELKGCETIFNSGEKEYIEKLKGFYKNDLDIDYKDNADYGNYFEKFTNILSKSSMTIKEFNDIWKDPIFNDDVPLIGCTVLGCVMSSIENRMVFYTLPKGFWSDIKSIYSFFLKVLVFCSFGKVKKFLQNKINQIETKNILYSQLCNIYSSIVYINENFNNENFPRLLILYRIKELKKEIKRIKVIMDK